MLELFDQISNALNDLWKAFDTMDHNMLIQKLEHYGINGKSLSWFKNYMTNRKQYIQYESNNNNNGVNNNNNKKIMKI